MNKITFKNNNLIISYEVQNNMISVVCIYSQGKDRYFKRIYSLDCLYLEFNVIESLRSLKEDLKIDFDIDKCKTILDYFINNLIK